MFPQTLICPLSPKALEKAVSFLGKSVYSMAGGVDKKPRLFLRWTSKSAGPKTFVHGKGFYPYLFKGRVGPTHQKKSWGEGFVRLSVCYLCWCYRKRPMTTKQGQTHTTRHPDTTKAPTKQGPPDTGTAKASRRRDTVCEPDQQTLRRGIACEPKSTPLIYRDDTQTKRGADTY